MMRHGDIHRPLIRHKLKLMSERRKSKRWLLSAYFETFADDGDNSLGYLAEVSRDGMMVLNKEPIQTNIVMPLRISLQEEAGNSQDMKVVGKVVRCQKDKDMDYYDTGFKLIEISEENQEMIERLIQFYAFDKPSKN